MGWFDFEQGVEARSGHGSVILVSESDASRLERSFDTPGQNERPCEKQTKPGPAKVKLQEAKWGRDLFIPD